jgi:parallel beta-helix repeat protein
MGLELESGANYNIVTMNQFTSDGVFVYDAWKNHFSNNFVNGQPLVYLEDVENNVVNESAGQVILISCESVTVTNQCISNCTVGMLIVDSNHCDIIQNCLDRNRAYNLFLTHSNTIFISKNIIANSSQNILIENSEDNVIEKNNIRSAAHYGIWLELSNNNTISHNLISDNSKAIESLGMWLFNSSDNIIDHNNFLRNTMNAVFLDSYRNKWRANYWERPRFLPKFILGRRGFILPWFNIDWFPAKILNDI